MKGIPPEIDALMWQLAEGGGPVAQAEFEARHTRYGPELSRRMRMVAELREAGKVVHHRPNFSPRPATVAPSPRWAVGAVIGMAVLAVGAVAYVSASGEKLKPAPIPAPRPVSVRPAETPPLVVVSPPRRESPSVENKPQEKTPTYLLPRDVQITETNLTAAIQLVAAGGGLKVTVAPGFHDQKVTFDYRGSGLNTVDTLKAMGEQYGFSVLEEGEGAFLVVPAREATAERRIGT